MDRHLGAHFGPPFPHAGAGQAVGLCLHGVQVRRDPIKSRGEGQGGMLGANVTPHHADLFVCPVQNRTLTIRPHLHRHGPARVVGGHQPPLVGPHVRRRVSKGIDPQHGRHLGSPHPLAAGLDVFFCQHEASPSSSSGL